MPELDLSPKPASVPAAIAPQVQATPALMFTNATVAEKLFSEIEAEIAAFRPDLSTQTGRKAIASLAFKVAETKTAIDKAGLALTEGWRNSTTKVNAERTTFKTRLQQLQDKARAPLTAWEEAEDKRQTACRALIDQLKADAVVELNDTAAMVRERYARVKEMALDDAQLQEFAIMAHELQRTTLGVLERAYARLVKDEADRAELKRLQDAEAARQVELSNQAAAAETLRREQAAQREADERETEKLAEAASIAAAHAKQEAEEEAQRKIDAANAEAEALRQQEATRLAEAARVAEETSARERDTAHRNEVIAKASAAMLEISGISKTAASKLALSIAAGNIPGVKMEF